MPTLYKARLKGGDLVEEHCGLEYVLLLDKLGSRTYVAIWGRGRERVEVSFPRRMGRNDCATITRYVI